MPVGIWSRTRRHSGHALDPATRNDKVQKKCHVTAGRPHAVSRLPTCRACHCPQGTLGCCPASRETLWGAVTRYVGHRWRAAPSVAFGLGTVRCWFFTSDTSSRSLALSAAPADPRDPPPLTARPSRRDR